MSDEKVCTLLRSLELENLIPVFRESAIDDDLIADLTDQDLAELGLKLGHRKKFKKLATETGVAASAPGEPGQQMQSASEDLSNWERLPGERKNISILFADITGSTALTESLDSEDAHDLLYGATRIMCESVENNRGHVARFMGDGLMAMFGVPLATEHHARDACLAALDMQNSIRSYVEELQQRHGQGLRVRIGINSGEVVMLTVGDGDNAEFDASGPEVPLAARMEQSASPGTIQITESTKALASDNISTTELPPVRVKGFPDPVPAWELTGLDLSADGDSRRWHTRFVGRQTEIAQFNSVVAICQESEAGHIVYVRGPAGIGKTRLVDEFSTSAQGGGMTCHKSLVLDFGASRGQETIPTIVASLLGASGSEDQEANLDAIARAISEGMVKPDQEMYLHDLLGLPLGPDQKSRFDSLDNVTRQRGRESVVSSLVRSASLQNPLLLTIEDLHWADNITLNYLAEIGASISDSQVIMLMTSRVEGDQLDDSWRGRVSNTGFVTLDLSPLRPREASALAEDISNSDESFVRQCIERSEGNPLFLEQLLRTERGIEDGNLPDSILTLVQSKMDRLPEKDRAAIQAASIIGQRFTQELVQFLVDDNAYECKALLTHHLVRVEGDGFLFAHALIREGVYQSLLSSSKRKIHSKAADWFKPMDAPLYAEHLDRAGDETAAQAYIEAAQELVGEYRYAKALALTERAVTLSKAEEDRQPMLCFKAETLLELGQVDKSVETFELAMAEASSDQQRCLAQIGMASTMRIQTRYDDALELLDLAQPIAESIGMDHALSVLHHLRGNLMFPLGKSELCRQEHQSALDYAEKIDSSTDTARALGGLGDAAYAAGHMQSAHGYFSRCLEVSDEHGFGKIKAAYNAMVPFTILYLLRHREALPISVEAVESACELGHLRAEMNARGGFCHIAYDIENVDLDVFEEHASRTVELSTILGAKAWRPLGLIWLTVCQYRRNNQDQAEQTIAEAVEIGRNYTFNSGRVFGTQAYVTNEPTIRENALKEGEKNTEKETISHNHLWFNRYAMDAMMKTRELDRARYYADRLEKYTSGEPLPWAEFFISRTRILADWYENPDKEEPRSKVEEFVQYAEKLGLDYPIRHIKKELEQG
jgi:class 3 adenylate cyclase/tetratricopeptide (TPR) repeat protein